MRIIVCLTLLTLYNCVLAGGFETQLQGTRQLGMAGAGVATLHDASGLLYNPATVAFLKERLSVSVNMPFSSSKTVFYDPQTDVNAETERNAIAVPSVFVNYRLNEHFSVGLAAYSPLQVSTEWENDWRGRFLSSLYVNKVYVVQPSVAYQFNKKFALSGGLVIGSSEIQVERDLPVTSSAGTRVFSNLQASASAVGVNLGLFYKIHEDWNLGINYRSQLQFDYLKGNTEFSVPENSKSTFPESDFKSFSNLPYSINFGLSNQSLEHFVITAEMNVIGWNVQRFVIYDFKENTSELNDVQEPQNYANAYFYKLGIQYQPSCCLILRGGISVYNSPINERFFNPNIPDLDKTGFHVGISYSINEWLTVDAAGVWWEGKTTEGLYSPTDFSGFYKSRTQTGSLGVQIIF